MMKLQQIRHAMDINGRILDYMDELDNMTEDVDPATVRLRLRNILGAAENAAFELSLARHPDANY